MIEKNRNQNSNYPTSKGESRARAKIGILNVQYGDNFGAVLLCYALQETIRKMGYDPEVIDYRPKNPSNIVRRAWQKVRREGVIGIFKTLYKKIICRDKAVIQEKPSLKKIERFELFRNQYLKRSVVFDGAKDIKKRGYDVYVVGSDLVWKPERVKEEADVYFLTFTKGKDCRRISYAASLGTDDEDILRKQAKKFRKLIEKFDFVSVREKSSVTYIESFYRGKVYWCVDPTLLLERKDYEKLLPDKTCAIGYIYLYLLNDNEEAHELARKCSQEFHIPIFGQSPNSNRINEIGTSCADDGPLEFIERIKDARFIITDSFHGTIFSIIFEKQFMTFSRGSISIRMQDLLQRLEMLDRYVPNGYADIHKLNERIEYNSVKEIINNWKRESMEFLEKSLAGIS